MPCYRIPNGVVCIHNVHSVRLPNGKLLSFEYSELTGPSFLRKDGFTIRQRVPAGGWEAFDKWLKRRKPKTRKPASGP